jgi:hypothetical protein
MRISDSQLRRLIRESILLEGASTILPPGITEKDIFEYMRKSGSKLKVYRLPDTASEDPQMQEAIELLRKLDDISSEILPTGNHGIAYEIHKSLGYYTRWERLSKAARASLRDRFRIERDGSGSGTDFADLLKSLRVLNYHVDYDMSYTSPSAKEALRDVADTASRLDKNMMEQVDLKLECANFWATNRLEFKAQRGERAKLLKIALDGWDGAMQAMDLIKSMGY